MAKFGAKNLKINDVIARAAVKVVVGAAPPARLLPFRRPTCEFVSTSRRFSTLLGKYNSAACIVLAKLSKMGPERPPGRRWAVDVGYNNETVRVDAAAVAKAGYDTVSGRRAAAENFVVGR